MKIYQSFLISALLLSITNQNVYAQEVDTQMPQSNVEEKQQQSVWKKASKWFGAIGLAAVSAVVLYQGVQYGHGKYIESKHEENPKYGGYMYLWDAAKEEGLPIESQVLSVLNTTFTPADLDLAQEFFQAEKGYIFARSKMVQDAIKKRREAIKKLNEQFKKMQEQQR